MSAAVEFKDYSRAWLEMEKQNLTNALEAMADAIMKNAKVKAPKLTGTLQYSSHINRISPTEREIVFGGTGIPYAMYQERGKRADGTHVVRHYTTPGTGAHYLEQSGDRIVTQGIGVYKR